MPLNAALFSSTSSIGCCRRIRFAEYPISAATSGVPTNTSFLLRSAGIGIATRSTFICRRRKEPNDPFRFCFADDGGSTGIA
jgi:hypothetical protein